MLLLCVHFGCFHDFEIAVAHEIQYITKLRAQFRQTFFLELADHIFLHESKYERIFVVTLFPIAHTTNIV